jgi:FkbM family methyltransferase
VSAYAAVRRWLRTARLSTRVSPSARFAARELRHSPGVWRYRLRGAPYEVFLRHNGGDAYVLDEVFGPLQHYRFPPQVKSALRAEREVYRVADLGANIGLFGLLASIELPGCELTAFEPDPENAELLDACVDGNGLRGRWRVIRALAASSDSDAVPFVASSSPVSRIPASGDDDGAIEVEAVDAFPYLDSADLIKLDVEGGEWELLGDARFSKLPARAIVLEYHAYRCPADNPQRAALEALHGTGFQTLVQPEDAGLGTLWGWR